MKENGIVTKKEVFSKALFRAMASSSGEKSSGASRVAIVLIYPHIANFFPKFRRDTCVNLTPQLFYEIKKHQYSIGLKKMPKLVRPHQNRNW